MPKLKTWTEHGTAHTPRKFGKTEQRMRPFRALIFRNFIEFTVFFRNHTTTSALIGYPDNLLPAG